jgi:O-antigen/teichoic acid export membrane protein
MLVSLIAKLTDKFGRHAENWRGQKDVWQRLRSIGHLLTGNFASAIIGLVGFAMTARALGPADYGVLALCFSFSRAMEKLVTFQSWQPLIKFGASALEAGDLGDLRRLLKFGLMLDIGAALVAWIVAILLIFLAAPFLGITPETRTFALIYCTVLPFQISGMPTAALRLYGKFSVLAYGQVLGSIMRVVLCAIGIALSWKLFEFTLIWMGMQIFGSLSMTFLALRELRRRGIENVLTAPLRGITQRFPGLWRFALSANLSLTIRSSANELDTLLVGLLADPVSAGFYHIAKRIGRTAQQAGVQVQAVVYPELAKLWASRSLDKFKSIVTQTEWMLMAAGASAVVIVFLAIKPILFYTAGEKFLAAAPLVTVQAFAVMMLLSGTVMRSALLAMGRENAVLRAVMISTAGFHITAFSLIPVIGAMGANVAHIVMSTIWMAAMLISYRFYIAEATAGVADGAKSEPKPT